MPTRFAEFAIGAFLAAAAAGTQTPVGVIEGVVVRAETNEPIFGARITLQPERGGSAITSGDGGFAFVNVDAGSYSLTVDAYGYVKTQISQVVTAGQSARVVLRMTTMTGALSGRVRNEAGDPIAGAQVHLLRNRYLASGVRTLTSAGGAQTDQNGDYRLTSVPPGRYYMQVTSIPVIPDANGIQRRRPTSRYYPGVLDLSTAVPIDVRPVLELSALDFVIRTEPSYGIRGRLIDSTTGGPPGAAAISLVTRDLANGTAMAGYTPRFDAATGAFEVRDVPRGSYLVRAVLRSGATTHAAVDLYNFDVEDIILAAVPPSAISGRVQIDGPRALTALTAPEMRVDLRPSINGQQAMGLPSPKSEVVTADGLFGVSNLYPGEYQQNVSMLPSGYYLKEARYDGADVLNRPLHFRGGSGLLEVVLSVGAAQVGGTIVDEQGNPVPGAVVALIPRLERQRVALFRTATAAEDGRFAIPDITPGDYQIFSWRSIQPYAYFDPQFLLTFESQSQAIHLGELSAEHLELKVIH